MNRSIEQQIEALGLALQAHPVEDGFTRLQETYQELRQAFAHLVFQVKHYQAEHYAWLLMNQDAACSLVILSRLYADWQQVSPNEVAKAKYIQALDDFKWLIATALLCVA